MCRFGFSAIAFAVSVFASTAHCQELTKDELTTLFDGTVARAGVSSEGTASVVVTRPDGTATLYWGFPSTPRVNPGMWRIQGNKYCRKWEGVPAERCTTVRKTGPDNYESWDKDGFGDDRMHSRFYFLRRE